MGGATGSTSPGCRDGAGWHAVALVAVCLLLVGCTGADDAGEDETLDEFLGSFIEENFDTTPCSDYLPIGEVVPEHEWPVQCLDEQQEAVVSRSSVSCHGDHAIHVMGGRAWGSDGRVHEFEYGDPSVIAAVCAAAYGSPQHGDEPFRASDGPPSAEAEGG